MFEKLFKRNRVIKADKAKPEIDHIAEYAKARADPSKDIRPISRMFFLPGGTFYDVLMDIKMEERAPGSGMSKLERNALRALALGIGAVTDVPYLIGAYHLAKYAGIIGGSG